VYICSVLTYAHGCFIGLQEEEEETADIAGNEEECSLYPYRIVKFLDRGGFGHIILVKRMSGSCFCCKQVLFAMKAVRKDTICRDIVSRRNVEEDVFMLVDGHPFLVQLHSYFQTKVVHSF
jgi:hypothetical protein